jgi:hypothetical protein
LPGPVVVDDVPVDPTVPDAPALGATTVVDPAAAVPGATIVPGDAALPAVDPAAGGGTVDEPDADGAIALLRTGVSPVVAPAAAPAPALWCDCPIELPLAVTSTFEPRVLRLREYSVPDKIPPGASLSGTEWLSWLHPPTSPAPARAKLTARKSFDFDVVDVRMIDLT